MKFKKWLAPLLLKPVGTESYYYRCLNVVTHVAGKENTGALFTGIVMSSTFRDIIAYSDKCAIM